MMRLPPSGLKTRASRLPLVHAVAAKKRGEEGAAQGTNKTLLPLLPTLHAGGAAGEAWGCRARPQATQHDATQNESGMGETRLFDVAVYPVHYICITYWV